MLRAALPATWSLGSVELDLPGHGSLHLHTLQRGVGQVGYPEPMLVLREVHHKLPIIKSLSISTLNNHLFKRPGPKGHTETLEERGPLGQLAAAGVVGRQPSLGLTNPGLANPA